MPDFKTTFGFCPMCMQNVEHTRKFSSQLANLIDMFTFRALRFFRLGPWYCYQCEGKTIYLRNVKRSMPTFHRSSSHVDYNPGLEPQSDPSQPPDESIGNYLKSEHSLLIREQRSHRYSQNFRDSAVTRVLSGTIPLKQICRELDIHEADIIHWIDDFVMRKQVRIDQLTHLLESIQQELPPHLQMTMDEMEEEFESKIKNVVEGRVMPT